MGKFDQLKITNIRYDCLFMFGFYGISTIVGYLMPNPFLYKNSPISNNSLQHEYTVW